MTGAPPTGQARSRARSGRSRRARSSGRVPPRNLGVVRVRVDLADGRTIEVAVAGPDSGTPLVFHHGTPGAAVPYPPMVEAAARRGLRTVQCSRPGYAGSTALPGRTVAAVAADTAAVLDALGAGEFVTLGHSGGGPHALACAALLPDRCRAAASVAGPAPFDAEGLDWMDGMGAENLAEFGAAVTGAGALAAFLEAQRPALLAVRSADLVAALGDLLSPVDRKQFTGEYADHIAESFHAALASGIAGWQDDDLAFVRDWGFPLAQARRVTIWHGAQDRMVPYPHGAWLASRLPGATARLYPDEGHLSVFTGNLEEILADLTAEAA
jgi:pimeloyl-ACP methyl ester carboxylesterase